MRQRPYKNMEVPLSSSTAGLGTWSLEWFVYIVRFHWGKQIFP